MILGDIIREYREVNNLTIREFANRAGLSRAYLGFLESNCNPRTGKPPVPTMETLTKVANTMFMSFDELIGMLDDDSSVNISDNKLEFVKKAVRIPVLGKVAAGIPIEAVEDVIDYEEISESMARTGEFFALKIKGDSMEPRICDGDIAIVRKQEDATSGDIVIVLVNGDEATCKRYAKYKNGIKLMPLNPKYDPISFTNEEIESKPVRIIGKVVENRQKF